MNIVNGFDQKRLYLGKLCPQGHDWNSTGKSLRLRSNWTCLVCKQERDRKYIDKNYDKVQARRFEYRQKNREVLAQKQREYYQENIVKVTEYDRARYIQNREKRIEYQRHYYATNREKINNSIKSSYNKRWRKRNAERIRQAFKLRRQTERGKTLSRLAVERRRSRKASVHSCFYTVEQVQQRFQDFDNCCAYCDAPATSIDHAIPISKGGADVLGNLLPSCQPCNSSKGARDMETWYKSSPHFTKARWKRILKVLGITESQLGQLPLF